LFGAGDFAGFLHRLLKLLQEVPHKADPELPRQAFVQMAVLLHNQGDVDAVFQVFPGVMLRRTAHARAAGGGENFLIQG